ncbi:MAG: hypothetical protein GY841_05115, partial [FCB group bacterium]|nr:hypothetical protein [FCB group bacterium]
CDNANGVKPFGAIDTPTQGGTISGSGYLNYGWALTPLPNTIPKDGSTIIVWVDGVPLGNPVYNQYREDVEAYFPGLNNSGGAFGYFYIDTAGYPNGRHYIYWTVEDDAGNADGIGSRYFNIQNASNIQNALAGQSNHRTHSRTFIHAHTRARINRIEREAGVPLCFAPLPAAVGFEPNPVTANIYPGPMGLFQLEMNELGRVEVHPGPGCSGFLEVGEKLYPLPVGSTLDREKG